MQGVSVELTVRRHELDLGLACIKLCYNVLNACVGYDSGAC